MPSQISPTSKGTAYVTTLRAAQVKVAVKLPPVGYINCPIRSILRLSSTTLCSYFDRLYLPV
jgi:hypothetical protein